MCRSKPNSECHMQLERQVRNGLVRERDKKGVRVGLGNERMGQRQR